MTLVEDSDGVVVLFAVPVELRISCVDAIPLGGRLNVRACPAALGQAQHEIPVLVADLGPSTDVKKLSSANGHHGRNEVHVRQ